MGRHSSDHSESPPTRARGRSPVPSSRRDGERERDRERERSPTLRHRDSHSHEHDASLAKDRSISPPPLETRHHLSRGLARPVRESSGSPVAPAPFRSPSPPTKRLKRAQSENRESETNYGSGRGTDRDRDRDSARGSDRDMGIERKEKRSSGRDEIDDNHIDSGRNRSSRSRNERSTTSPEHHRNGRSRHRSQSPQKPAARDETTNSRGAEHIDIMDSEVETIEGRLTSLLGQLQVECGILERMVYKNKNQHRRCSYFQYLLKVRRDLRLLQSTNLEELVISCFLVIKGDRPKQKIHLLESLKRRKCNSGKHNFLERILGAARLLVEMVEPMLKAATEVSVLFAQSFFMGFSLTIMAALARLRVLVQQILLDVVTLFNMVSSLSQKKQSIKINQEGLEVFREFFPVSEDFVVLECVWKSDKFILLERKCKRENASQGEDSIGSISVQASAVNYISIESCLGETANDQLVSGGVDADAAANDGPSPVEDVTTDLLTGSSLRDNQKEVGGSNEEGRENSGTIEASFKELPPKDDLGASLNSHSKLSSCSKKVAYVSIKSKLSTQQGLSPLTATVNESNETKNDKEDTLASVLADGIAKDSVF